MPPETDNLKLQEIFQDDQKDREKVYDTPEALESLRQADENRKRRVYVMMDLGEISTKNDLYHASVILMHATDPADFLTAHRIAAVAAIQGHKSARYVCAASLDRYLMSVGIGQVYGTQFEFNPDDRRYQLRLPVTEQTFLSFEKEFLGVPMVADRLKALNAQIGSRG